MMLPESGRTRHEIMGEMRVRKTRDAAWFEGRTFSLVYPTDTEVDEVMREAHELYLFENALNPFRFPSLAEMHDEVVGMTAGLLHAPGRAGGSMTSGGTESIVMAMLVARERARHERGIAQPQLLAPASAHPAFAKAAKYLQMELVQIPLGEDLRADVTAARALVTDRTAVIVGSAPGYPHGVVDPISDLAALALEHGAAFHTDACIGGFLLPFLARLGHSVPPFDFEVEGVTSISADVHKYGYATKGASVVLHREKDWWFQHQLFLFDRWPGGLYGSPALAGARPAAPIAAAWAVMMHLGASGYTALAQRAWQTAQAIRHGIGEIPGLRVLGDPVATVLAFTSDTDDIFAVGDVMDDRGWHLDRQTDPDALHLMVSPAHDKIVTTFLTDLRDAVAHHGESRGKDARYS